MRNLLVLAIVLAPAAAHAEGARVLHVPPLTASADQPLRLVAAIDGAWKEADLVVKWRSRGGDAGWHDAPFRRSSTGGWYATIPGDGVGKTGVEYFIVGHFASAEAPHVVPVVAGPIDQLAEQDRARADGRADAIDLDVDGHDFGNRLSSRGVADHFVRGEARWTHQFYRTLYATSFGFGAIDGVTPDLMEMNTTTRARYGFGAVRLRFEPGVFVDGHVALGFSHDGFIGGTGAQLTLGRPWATCVQLGADYLGDMGGTGWIRLQWDTAPPLLMGASVVKTDLPGAVLTDGVYARYDIAYRVVPQVTARAAISLGARDGGPHLGGALGVGYEF